MLIVAPFATVPVHDCMPLSPSVQGYDAWTTWPGVYTAPFAGTGTVMTGG